MNWPAESVPSQQALAPPSFWIEIVTVVPEAPVVSTEVPDSVEFQPTEL